MTKREQAIIDEYKKHAFTYFYSSVNVVYGRPSQYKQLAEERIIEEMHKNNGYGYCIMTYNTHMFTCGYMWTNSDGVTLLRYHLPTTYIDIDLSEEIEKTINSI